MRDTSGLDELTAAVERGERCTITVRELLRLFGAERRGSQVVRELRKELRRRKLRSTPDLAEAEPDAFISLERAAPRSGSRAGHHVEGTASEEATTKVTGATANPGPSTAVEVDRLTIFSFGYWGWGNCTRQLVEEVDAVEQARGFDPPVFVDIRIRRAVRAKGFRQDAFAQTLGDGRYAWLRDLGNEAVLAGDGLMRLADPDRGVPQLLGLASEAASHRQRVIFYCACEFRKIGGQRNCHRDLVSELTKEASQDARRPCEVVEWPGGEPLVVNVRVSDRTIQEVLRGRRSVPLASTAPLSTFGALPWGSVAVLASPNRQLPVLTGPAHYQKGWVLPLLDEPVREDASVAALQNAAEGWRRWHGWN